MSKRPSGRPKATDPRDVTVLVRLTEAEADELCRAKPDRASLAGFLRRCAFDYLHLHTISTGQVGHARPDTTEAQKQRARRAERRANAAPQRALEAQIGQALQAAGEDLAADAAAPVG